MTDTTITLIGGRGPHGLVFHLLMQDLGFTSYTLVDPEPEWLSLYGPSGPMQAVTQLRSPRELDFSLGKAARSMAQFKEQGSFPLAQVYSLSDAEDEGFNENSSEANRAPRETFWRYANHLAKTTGADKKVIQAKVSRLESAKGHWRVHLGTGESFSSKVILLATGLMPHLYLPQPWHIWWQHLPQDRVHHAFKLNYQKDCFKGEQVAVLGSSNIATWEAAIKLAELGANVTLLSRYLNPIERQLPFASYWFKPDFIEAFSKLDWQKRQQKLKKPHIPASSMPGTAAKARAAGVRVLHYARVQYASELWGGVQLFYKTTEGLKTERFDHLVAATGSSPKIRELPFLAELAREYKAPIIVNGVGRYRPILDEAGRWKNLPPLYPLGAHALTRAGHAANTLASATVYLPLLIPHILQDAGFEVSGSDLLAA